MVIGSGFDAPSSPPPRISQRRRRRRLLIGAGVAAVIVVAAVQGNKDTERTAPSVTAAAAEPIAVTSAPVPVATGPGSAELAVQAAAVSNAAVEASLSAAAESIAAQQAALDAAAAAKASSEAEVAASATAAAVASSAAAESAAAAALIAAEVPAPAPPALEVVAPGEQATASLVMLAGIEVKGRAAKTGYDRDLFGQAWSDDVDVDGGRNGCDTRNDILRRDLSGLQIKPGSNGCTVLAGTLADPYTDKTIDFVRGDDTSSAVQIDHVVALSDAWQKGAQGWDEGTRRNFANDPRNLQAADGPANQQKSDGDAATWLPSNRGFWCTYVTRQIEVKAEYGLWMTQAEYDRIAKILTEDCDGEPTTGTTVAPSSTPSPDQPDIEVAAVPTETSVAVVPVEPAPPVDDAYVYYENCDAVRAAGAAPIYPTDPGWEPKFDRNKDGVGCETD